LTNENVGTLGNLGYKYDPVGNRTNRLSTGSVSTPLPSAINSFSQNDWLTNDAYDSNGNTLWDTNATAVGPYFYDVENRLINFNNAVYLGYNGDGIRVTKTANGTNYYYLVDDRNPTGYAQVLEEWTASGGATNLSRVFAFGLSLISQRQPNIGTNYFITDGHGSTRVLTDNGGAVVNTFTYDGYGTLIASNVAPQTAYLYCGEQLDSNLGFYYLRARYFNPQTGRFQTMDTYEGGQVDPQSLHKYIYCEDDSVNATDPRGLDIWLCTRTTDNGFPAYGIGRHAYLWDDRTNAPSPRSCGQEGNCTYGCCLGTSNNRDIGPIAGQTNALPSDVQAYVIQGSRGHEDEIMTYARQHINDQWLWWPSADENGAGGNDCHAAAVAVLQHFPYLIIPPHLRYNPGDRERIERRVEALYIAS
jgi:RHS repeat-associated protein